MHDSFWFFLCLERMMLFRLLYFPYIRVSITTKVSNKNRIAQDLEHCDYMGLCFGQFVTMQGACAFLCGAFVILVDVFFVCTGSLCLAVNESSCVHRSSSWKEWKREYSKEGATERKRKGFQTRTGMAMAALWPSSNRSNQQPSILWNRGSEISLELAWFMAASKQDIKIKHSTAKWKSPTRMLQNSTK